ncbi:glycoside hydrolase family 3 N-terminal domain-containing protein [Anaeromassilibacillus sp. SJQ-1]|uniref:glycoside hydrolase family 3 N-terminal domain-containing protein n=1 Tax=Anaeromassilibacillus sp. SJQ-1 TaxID=3375419 RepID=UPI00398A0D06
MSTVSWAPASISSAILWVGATLKSCAEDPYLTGKLGAAVTRGMQSVGVATAVKHFAVNSTEFSRLASNGLVSSRAMREIYLKAFEIVIKEAYPWSIMTSYNFVNGTKAAELEPMMNEIARGEWGYDGVFMTDWEMTPISSRKFWRAAM